MAGRIVRTHDDSRLYTLAGPILSGIVLKAIRAERRARDIGAAELSSDFVGESEAKYHRHLAAMHQFVELLDTHTGRELVIGPDNLDSATGDLAFVLGDCDLQTAVKTLGDRCVNTLVGQDQANLDRPLILSIARNTDSGREDGCCTENGARTFLERECQANLPIAVANLIPPQDSSLAAAICGNPARTVMAIVIDQQPASHLQQSAGTYERTPFCRNAKSQLFRKISPFKLPGSHSRRWRNDDGVRPVAFLKLVEKCCALLNPVASATSVILSSVSKRRRFAS